MTHHYKLLIMIITSIKLDTCGPISKQCFLCGGFVDII